ncbi:hypothetical protein XBO1_480061 [Xenorhabdus bovienii str. oregonense]|uniref:Uncharacterized protein n=1 Tax=Xenorhabdus bovienii str. oregonense TaxID=1398202 RepID=A0A077PD97_XENBV|nr:hypothetical protein XBO1_480061 [Xenorhabdus bovienii str. oregonense]
MHLFGFGIAYRFSIQPLYPDTKGEISSLNTLSKYMRHYPLHIMSDFRRYIGDETGLKHHPEQMILGLQKYVRGLCW